ncbi:MAG TPA: HAD hydrolase family protein [Solirubrobacterales bacterium]
MNQISTLRSLRAHDGYRSEPTMGLSCVYVDLDGTLLGKGSSLFRDAEGRFSLAQARALEACERGGVEVVIMSGRREAQVHEAARLMGQASYIYEAGCAFAIEGETTLLTGDLVPDEDGTVYEKIEERGIPKMLFERFESRLEYHSPWHHGRVLSHLFRGKVDVGEANELLAADGHEDLRLLDNGAIGTAMAAIDGPTHAYHLVPRIVSKANAVAAHARARGHDPADCIGVGDSVEDLEVAAAVGRFFVVANGPQRDPGLRAALGAWDNVTVTEGAMGDGFYEAVVSTLVERR